MRKVALLSVLVLGVALLWGSGAQASNFGTNAFFFTQSNGCGVPFNTNRVFVLQDSCGVGGNFFQQSNGVRIFQQGGGFVPLSNGGGNTINTININSNNGRRRGFGFFGR